MIIAKILIVATIKKLDLIEVAAETHEKVSFIIIWILFYSILEVDKDLVAVTPVSNRSVPKLICREGERCGSTQVNYLWVIAFSLEF